MEKKERSNRRKRASPVFYDESAGSSKRSWRNKPIPLRERWLIALVVLWVGMTLFWYRGGLGWTGNLVSLGLGLVTYLTAFLPFGNGFKKGWKVEFEPLRKLLRFPFFWIGFALLLYAGIQIHNTAYVYQVTGNNLFSLVPRDHISWLPSGVIVPIDSAANPFTVFIQILLPWMLVSVLACGLSNRRSCWIVVRWVLGLIVIWVCMALWHYHTGMKELYGWIKIGRNNLPPYWGSFKNPNHGGLLQVMGGALAFGLSVYALKRAAMVGRSYGLSVFLFFVAIFLGYATLDSLSRGAILLFVLLLLGYLFLLLSFAVREGQKGLILGGLGMLLIIGLVSWGYVVHKQNNVSDSAFERTIKQTEYQIEGRVDDGRFAIYKVAYHYGIDALPWGTGIGSWRYFYRNHLQPGEERVVYRLRGRTIKNPVTGKRERFFFQRARVWEHAHNDWLQMFCEFGIGWLVTIGVSLFFILRWLFFNRFSIQILEWMLIMGIVFIGVASTYEFPLRTPALGLVFAVMLAFLVGEVSFKREKQKDRSK